MLEEVGKTGEFLGVAHATHAYVYAHRRLLRLRIRHQHHAEPIGQGHMAVRATWCIISTKNNLAREDYSGSHRVWFTAGSQRTELDPQFEKTMS